MTLIPFARRGFKLVAIDRTRRYDKTRLCIRRWKGMIAPGNAARNLQINQAVANTIAAHRFAQHDLHRIGSHGRAHSQLFQGAREPVQMTPLVDQLPAPHLTNLVHTVGKLIAAVFDMHTRRSMRHIPAIHISNS
jgi:hypothetical protein